MCFVSSIIQSILSQYILVCYWSIIGYSNFKSVNVHSVVCSFWKGQWESSVELWICFAFFRGNPDGLVICHLPNGPTAYFNLTDVVMRHDIPNIGTMSEQYPHLIFHNFKSNLGLRVMMRYCTVLLYKYILYFCMYFSLNIILQRVSGNSPSHSRHYIMRSICFEWQKTDHCSIQVKILYLVLRVLQTPRSPKTKVYLNVVYLRLEDIYTYSWSGMSQTQNIQIIVICLFGAFLSQYTK